MNGFLEKKKATWLKQKPLQPDPGRGWCSNDEFHRRLRYEKLRSERSEQPFSYVTIDFSREHQDRNRITDFEHYQFSTALFHIISDYTREFDYKHYDKLNKISILFVDTSIREAKEIVEKIIKYLYQHPKTMYLIENDQIIHTIQIAGYPLNLDPECVYIKATPVLLKQLKWENGGHRNHASIHQDIEVRMDWDYRGASKNRITLESPIFEETDTLAKNFQYQVLKRVFDVALSVFALAVLALPILVISIAIKLSSKGPVVYQQIRVGQFGKRFNFYKFRSMRPGKSIHIHKDYVKKLIRGELDEINNGTEENPMFKLVDDPRVTGIGKILRKLSLDELPQLMNVLKGEMSLVGPRPPIPYEVEEYVDWHYRRISEARPGITGLWQVTGRNTTTFNEMVRLDICYVDNWTFGLDIKIILKTVLSVLGKEGN